MIRLATPLVTLALVPIVLTCAWLVLRRSRYPILRTIVLAVAILAAASPFFSRETLNHNVLFVVDRSASLTQTASDDAVRGPLQQIMERTANARFGMIEFAKAPVVSAPLGMTSLPLGISSIESTETNLVAAIELALSILPDGHSNQLVLASDGQFSDNALQALSLAERAGLPISVVPVGTALPNDVSLSSLSAPDTVQLNRPFSLELEINAQSPAHARLVVYRDNDIVDLRELQLDEGTTRLAIQDELDQLGAFVYQALIKADGDPVSPNDDLSVLIRSSERPAVLLVDRNARSMVADLLDALSISYNTALSVPALELLAEYRQIILTSENLENYTLADLDTLDHFARQLGGGILFINGEHEVSGFSQGGVEALLPITFNIPEKTEDASLAIVYLLDRSASMKSRVDGVEKIDVLKEATVASINLLDPEALIGIIAFDRVHEWVLPISPIDFDRLIEALGPMDAIGGTDIYFPLVDALDRLEMVEARSKHILLISDGKAGDDVRDYPGLVRRLSSIYDTTLSAIAVGNSPNTTLLGALVNAGGGTLYLANDFSSLPQVSIRATQRLSRDRFVTADTAVSGRLLDGLNITDAPPVQGYVVSYPKETAETLLWGGEDPLVSSWRVGLGSITVLNTDLSGIWSREWAEWEGLSQLFDGILATTESSRASALGLSASVEVDGAETAILVEATDDGGGYANFLDIDANLLPLDRALELSQVSPGLYHAAIPTPAKGGYTIQVTDHTRGRSVSLPLTIPYSEEYARMGQNLDILSWIAEESGGHRLDRQPNLPDTVDRRTLEIQPLHWGFILATLVLFLLELILRKWPARSRRNPR